jgi:hypothetical protein
MRTLAIALLLTSSVSLVWAPQNALAGSGEVAAGVVGGLALGTLQCSELRLRAARATMHRPLSTSRPLPCMWNRRATGLEAPRFGTDTAVFGTGHAFRFATKP